MVCNHDFRASGSGNILYGQKEIPAECAKISFDTSHKLKTQFLAYDYVFDSEGNAHIVEISYGFAVHAYDACPGFWTENMV